MEDIILHEVIEHEKSKAVLDFASLLKNEIYAARQSNLEVLHDRANKYNINIFDDSFCCTCNGKILALDGIDLFIDNLLEFYK